MGWFTRKPHDLELIGGERILARLPLDAGAVAFVTSRRFVLRRPAHPDWIRAWWQIEGVSVESQERLLVVSDVTGDPVTIRLDEHDHTRFAAALRERVQSTLVDHRQVALRGGTVRVALRKAEGELFLQERWPGTVDRDEPANRAQVDELRRDLAASMSDPGLAGRAEPSL